MDFFFSGIQLHFTPGHYFHSLATNHLYFFMILHCFEQIMQFRYFVPAAAYSKDKYRLLFRESRVPAFFPVSLPGVSPTQESPSVAISGRLSRIRRGLSCCCGLVLRDCNKGTSSRCALRAPRPLCGLAMTNLWRSPSYRQPALAVSTAPGAAVPSPTMAGACIGSGPEFAGCTRCVGDAAPYNTPSILQQYPPKMQSLFPETAFIYRPNRRKCALPARFFCSGRRGRSGQKSADASVRS